MKVAMVRTENAWLSVILFIWLLFSKQSDLNHLYLLDFEYNYRVYNWRENRQITTQLFCESSE